VPEFLRVYYSDPANSGAGAGWNRLYASLKLSYVGIKQLAIQEFLRSVPVRQQVQPKLRSGVIRPITSRRAFGVVQIGETEYSGNHILLAKDIYSGYLWGKFKKNSHNTRDAIELIDKIADFAAERGASVGVVQADNGTIFTATELGDHLQNLGIRHLYSLTYNSRTQGAIEKANRDLMTKIVQYQFQPSQTDLQLFIDSHDATVSTTGASTSTASTTTSRQSRRRGTSEEGRSEDGPRRFAERWSLDIGKVGVAFGVANLLLK